MKKQRICIKLFGSSVAVVVCMVLAGTAVAYTNMGDMVDEGISYESAAPQKNFTGSNDTRANLEASMEEGIGYAESVVPEGQMVIKLDHRQVLQQGMEACLCEDPMSLVVESKISDYKTKALESQPAAGEMK